MQTKSKVLHLAMSVMIGGSLLAACGPTKTPNTTNPVSSNNPGNPASSNPSTPSSTSPASGSASNAAVISGEMQAVAADDATISDSQKADAGFATQMLGLAPAAGQIGALGDVRVGAALRTRVALGAATRAKLAAAREKAMNLAKAKKGALKAAGVTVNANGTVTSIRLSSRPSSRATSKPAAPSSRTSKPNSRPSWTTSRPLPAPAFRPCAARTTSPATATWSAPPMPTAASPRH